MPTMIYTPGVKVYISTVKHGVIDVSEDITDGTMSRRSDGVSTFNFGLSNPRRIYDEVFTPNDRVVVMMKRLTWVRVFTGLLNSVPLLSAFPGPVQLSASCSLKRLQYWYWDPHTAATNAMVMQALSAVTGTTSDGGVTNVVLTILDKVVGWPTTKVHIGAIPSNWFNIAKVIAQDVATLADQSDALSQALNTALTGQGVIAGQTNGSVSGALAAGTFGAHQWNTAQVTIAEQIYSAGLALGATQRDLIIGLMTAMQESTLQTGWAVYKKDSDSVGPFQQRPSQGWGTEAQCQDPTYSAGSFFRRLLTISNRTNMSEGQAAQAVQRSAYPDAYQKWLPDATAMVQVLIRASNSAAGLSAAQTQQGFANKYAAQDAATRTGGQNTLTGYAFAQAALDLVTQYPNIPYVQGDRSQAFLAKSPPDYLDCSSFVLAVLLRVAGSFMGMPPNTYTQIAWLKQQGMTKIPIDQALKTAGALIYMNGDGHVEVSLGTGSTKDGLVGAHHPGSPASRDGYYSSDGYGLLIPGFSYDTPLGNGVTGPQAVVGDSTNLNQVVTASTLPGFNANDPIDQLFGNANWYPDADDPQMQLSEALTGIRALLNDQPLLPYIRNLFASTMRSYCSAPNGDLIAWFPDYYGLWGTAAKLTVEPIELQNFTVEWSDDFFVTHQFTVAGRGANYLNLGSGSLDSSDLLNIAGGSAGVTDTVGIASIDIPAIMWALFGIEATAGESKAFTDFIYRRFGARPDFQEMPGLQGPKAEFFSALFMFMRQWALQYNADIPLTFMPEAFPGMLVQIPSYDFQAYIVAVNHSFRMGPNGSFSTSLNVAAPARMPKSGGSNGVLIGMPLAGGFQPGRDVTQ